MSDDPLTRKQDPLQSDTFLVVTHDPRIAERCDRVIEIVDGRIRSDRMQQREQH